MISGRTNNILNQLVALHSRSLASYLGYASPTWHRGDEKARDALSLMTEQQRDIADRIGELILSNGGVVDPGAFPMVFTGFHDLSFEYLLDQLIERQEVAVTEIGECASELSGEPHAYELAQEASGLAKGHLDTLNELKA